MVLECISSLYDGFLCQGYYVSIVDIRDQQGSPERGDDCNVRRHGFINGLGAAYIAVWVRVAAVANIFFINKCSTQ